MAHQTSLEDTSQLSERKLYFAGNATINQNVGAVSGLHEIADKGQVYLGDARHLHQVELLWCGTVRVHVLIFPFFPNKTMIYLIRMRTNCKAKKI